MLLNIASSMENNLKQYPTYLKIYLIQVLGILTVSLFLLFGTNSCSRPKPTGTLQIFFSGDLAGGFAPCGCKIPKGGVARRATFMKQQRIDGASELRLDVGNFTDLKQNTGDISTECIAKFFQMLNYQAINVSRRELSFDISLLDRLVSTYNLPMISANVLHPVTNEPRYQPYRIVQFPGYKVGCIGFTDQIFYKFLEHAEEAPFHIQPVMEAAKKWIPRMAKESDIVVVLTDMDYIAIDSLVTRYPQIDVVITSGVNPFPIEKNRYHNSLVFRTYTSGYRGTLINIDFDKSTSDSLDYRFINPTLTSDFANDSTMMDLVKDCTAKVIAASGQPDTTIVEDE
jgi:2',3'-cyclic-nucleotide 2'-phosphodiesterase (5'-nucleotidase family)